MVEVERRRSIGRPDQLRATSLCRSQRPCESRGAMFAREISYEATYTHKSPSRDPELAMLVAWMKDRPGSGLQFVGPLARSLEGSQLASDLVRRRFAIYRSARQWNGDPLDERVIALWPSTKLLLRLHDAVPEGGSLGVLPWTETHIEDWALATGAVDLLGQTARRSVDIDDEVMLGALRSLTDSVNLSSGISHPMDRDRAIETFKVLRRTGRRIDPRHASAWAMAHGWTAAHASRLGSLIKEINRGVRKRKSSNRSVLAGNALEVWTAIGAESDWKPR